MGAKCSNCRQAQGGPSSRVLTAPTPTFFRILHFFISYSFTTTLREKQQSYQFTCLRSRCGPPHIFFQDRKDCKSYRHKAAPPWPLGEVPMAEASSLPHRSDANKSQSSQPKHVQDTGLTKLDECTDEKSIVADIVFVHGLEGHPCKSWRYKEPKASKLPSFRRKAPQKSVFWPRDLLADDVSNVRIFTYGYDSKISHYGSGPVNQSNISQHGLSLLHDVSAQRHGCQDRYVLSRVIFDK